MYEQHVCPATAEHPRQTEASMVELANGSLLLAYTEFYGSDPNDAGAARIMGKRSADGGRNWSEAFLVQENIGGLNVMSASLLRLASGAILHTFLRKDTEWLDLHVMVSASTDEGQTWSAPRQISAADQYWCGTNDRLIQLASGRILYPVAIRLGHRSMAPCFLSDDDGATWRTSKRQPLMPNVAGSPEADCILAEPAAVELSNGDVLMLLRTRTGFIFQCRSSDGGESWSQPERAALAMPWAPCNCARLNNGDLLIVWNNHASVRLPLTAAISKDDGESWRHFRNLEDWSVAGMALELWTFCYPSILPVGDTVHLTYWETGSPLLPDGQFGPRLFHLKYRALPEAWFYGN